MAYKEYWKIIYNAHKGGAKKRGIAFEFTPQEWYNWWLSNGVDKNIPQTFNKDTLVMARYNDTGAYHPNNVYCCSNSQNCKDYDYSKRNFDYSKRKIDYSAIKRNPPKVQPKLFKPVVTPQGEFDSVQSATNTLRIDFYKRMKKYPQEYYYKEVI